VWPVPDDRDADLNAEHWPATAWVDELGAAVRERLGEIRDAACVIGHGDWHGGNVRFLDGRPLAVHDWDSALYEPEVVIVGQAAAVFQDGRTGGGASAGQSEAFLEAYQGARGRAFTKAELQLCWAAGLWVLAFNAKKFHLDGFDVLGRTEAESRMRLAGI
jgi:Ser/Thr protein kinase RdoA (MazF antagonist)